MRDCSFNAFESCNCGDQCKSAAIPLGRFTKSSDMTGVFTPSARFQFAFLAWVILTAAIGFGAVQLHQIDKQQEIAGRV